jgi:hypothetical protein
VDRALELTEHAVKDNLLMQPMLCDLWLRVSAANPALMATANEILSCAK